MHTNLIVSVNTSEPVMAGDSVSINCRVNIDRALVDVPIDIDLHLVSPRQTNATRMFINSNDSSLHQISIPFSNISARDSGNFICNATVRASSMNDFLIPVHESQAFDLILGKCFYDLAGYSYSESIFIQFHQGQALIEFKSQIIPPLFCGLKLWVIELTTTQSTISIKTDVTIHFKCASITDINKRL